jgi:hypothetical protein
VARVLARVFAKSGFSAFRQEPCVYHVRVIDGSHQGTFFEALLRKNLVPRQKFVQQHSGDWTMTGKVPVARVEGKDAFARTRTEG